MINKINLKVIVLILFLSGFMFEPKIVSADPELPLLGETGILNLKKEIELGSGLYKKLKEKGYVIEDPMLSRYLQDIGESLLSSLDFRVRDYYFYLVKDGSVNAFAAPGGYIGVNVGLIDITSSEDELASVLAHEIAHVELMHSMQMIERAKTINMASMISILAAILGDADQYRRSQHDLAFLDDLRQREIDFSNDLRGLHDDVERHRWVNRFLRCR
ncbi:MAG: M48 family metalloprotease, partial [Gammaproteobacteria bacterium]|nr:M48 family metalloprotease [Gammaproteobacteria bacterium]